MKIEYVICIYQEKSDEDLHLLADVIDGVRKQTMPVDLIILHDKETPKSLLKFCRYHAGETAQFICRPPTPSGKEPFACLWGFKWWYDQSTADYVCLNHSDDVPFPNRVKFQLQSLCQYPTAVMSLAGVMFHAKGRPENPLFFKLTDFHGWNIGYPSAWMLRKAGLPVLPFNPTINMRDDVELLLQILQKYPIVGVQIPLLRYNYGRTLQYSDTENAKTWKQYVEYWKSLDPKQLQPFYQYTDPTAILIFGFFYETYEGELFADQLELQGMEVFRIAVDQRPRKEIRRPIQGHILDDITDPEERILVNRHQKLVSVKKYEDQYHPAIILAMQCDLPLDYVGITTPIYGYISEIIWKRWFYNSAGITIPHGLFYAYHGAMAYYDNIHSYPMTQIPTTHRKFMPYAWSPEQYPPTDLSQPRDYPYFLGWMGATGDETVEENPDADFMQWHMRDLRAHYVKFAHDYGGMTIKPKGPYQEYGKFLAQCSLALNVPGMAGWVNQRQFHAPGVGCVLLQYRYKGIQEHGFKDMENCLLFGGNEVYHGYVEGEKELLEKLHWAEHHPVELERIRKAGQALAYQHTYEKKAQEFIHTVNLWRQEGKK